jgi:hypothetical protein
VKVASLPLDPSIGFEGMRLVSAIRDPGDREAAQDALRSGKSPDYVRQEFKAKREDDDPAARLLREKARIERAILSLQARLEDVEGKLRDCVP